MTIATVDRPLKSEMGLQEAQKITEEIRSNFDSLGKLLLEIKNRKGYRVLGYTSLESYCINEFGKGRSRVYQLIEEARVEEDIVSELASTNTNSDIKSLKMPGSYLRELKALETPRQQIEAIALANKLAENEGKKTTKLHLQVAINKIGLKPEQTKQSLKALGFDKGTEVEVIKGSAKGQRGVIRKIDKGIHVELYSGNSKPILYDISDLKCVPQAERPLHPACIDTVSIGDKIRVFSANKNNGKNGQIIARVNDKLALVEIEGYKVEIPYAEIEKITVTEEDFQQPSNDSIWGGKWNHLSSWYYKAREHKIYSFGCPDLILQPPKKCADPAEWLENWRQKNLKPLIEALFSQDDLANLTATAAAESLKKADKELNQLQLRLTEAEATIERMMRACVTTPPPSDFLLENNPQDLSPGETAPHIDFLLENSPQDLSPGEAAPHIDLLLENNPQVSSPGEVTLAHTDHLNIKLEDDENKIISWAKEVVNQIEDFCPGQLPLPLFLLNTHESSDPEEITQHTDSSPQIDSSCAAIIQTQIQIQREEILKLQGKLQGILETTQNTKERQKTRKNLVHLEKRLSNLSKMQEWQIGAAVKKINSSNSSEQGTIANLEFAQGGMPIAWVQWQRDSDKESFLDHHSLEVLQLVENQEEITP